MKRNYFQVRVNIRYDNTDATRSMERVIADWFAIRQAIPTEGMLINCGNNGDDIVRYKVDRVELRVMENTLYVELI